MTEHHAAPLHSTGKPVNKSPYAAPVFDPLRRPFFVPSQHGLGARPSTVSTTLPSVQRSATPSAIRTPGAPKISRTTSQSALVVVVPSSSGNVTRDMAYTPYHHTACTMCHAATAHALARAQQHLLDAEIASRRRLVREEDVARASYVERLKPLHQRCLRQLARSRDAAECVAAEAVATRAVAQCILDEAEHRRRIVLDAFKTQRALFRASHRVTRDDVETSEARVRSELVEIGREMRVAALHAAAEHRKAKLALRERLDVVIGQEARNRAVVASEELRAAVQLALMVRDDKDRMMFELNKRDDIAKAHQRHELQDEEDVERRHVIQLEATARGDLKLDVAARLSEIRLKAIAARRTELESRETASRRAKEVTILRDLATAILTTVVTPMGFLLRGDMLRQETSLRQALLHRFHEASGALRDREESEIGQVERAHRIVAAATVYELMLPFEGQSLTTRRRDA